MAQYGEVRVDYITYTTGTSPSEANATVTVSSLVNNPSFSGDITVEGNGIIEGNLNVSGNSTFNSIVVSGNSILNGDLTVSGNTVLNTLNVTGNTNLEDVEISGTLTVTGDATINGDLTVSGNIDASGIAISGFTGLFTDGTAANPSISFAADPDTGFFRRGNNSLALTTSGIQRFYVTNQGSVNIANSTNSNTNNTALYVESLVPGSGATIQQWGTTQSGGVRTCAFKAPDTDSYDAPFIFMTANAWTFQVDSFRSFNLDPAGRVGVGTQNPGPYLMTVEGGASGAPQWKSNIEARVHIKTRNQGAQTFNPSGPGLTLSAGGMNPTNKYTPAVVFASTDIDLTTTNPKPGAAIVSEATETYNNNTAGGMKMSFWTSANQPGTTPNLVERMVIDNNGRVGINATNLQGARLCIGENADNGIILRLNTDRPWQFKNLGTGSSSELSLEATSGGKNFSIRG